MGRAWPGSSASTTRRSPRSTRASRASTRSRPPSTAWTATRTRAEIADQLQAAGIEAVPVDDFGDLHDDPQIAHREHFVPLTHPFLGAGLYERNGFRVGDAPDGYDRPGPTLGQDNDWVLGELLGLPAEEQKAPRRRRRARISWSAGAAGRGAGARPSPRLPRRSRNLLDEPA